jgi:hypothetical protein
MVDQARLNVYVLFITALAGPGGDYTVLPTVFIPQHNWELSYATQFLWFFLNERSRKLTILPGFFLGEERKRRWV